MVCDSVYCEGDRSASFGRDRHQAQKCGGGQQLTVCLFYGTIILSVLLKDVLLKNPVMGIVLFIPAISFAIFSFVSYVKQYAYLKHEEIQKGNILKNRKED